jgi:Uncharacterised nucleotidyltransferase
MDDVDPAVRATAAGRLALVTATVEVLDAMVGAGIRAILLKGPATARLYGDPSLRPAGDVDLLVEPSQAGAAAQVLESLGFQDPLAKARSHEREAHAVAFYRSGPLPACVDLHRTMYWSHHDSEALWHEFSRATTFIELEDRRVEALGDPAQALVIAGHALRHLHAAKPLEDLRRALAVYEHDTWVEAVAMAKRLGAESVLAAGLRLVDAGNGLADALGLEENSASAEVRLRVAGPPPIALGVMRLAQTRSIRGRAAVALGEVFPTPAAMRYWHGFAGRGRAALAFAYLCRPVWLALKLPGAYRAWRAANSCSVRGRSLRSADERVGEGLRRWDRFG